MHERTPLVVTNNAETPGDTGSVRPSGGQRAAFALPTAARLVVGAAALLGVAGLAARSLAPRDRDAASAVPAAAQLGAGVPDVGSAALELKRSLLQTLEHLSNNPGRFAFGHQMTTYRGQFFSDPEAEGENSDVFNATSEFPVVYGFDFAHVIENEGNLAAHVTKAFNRGGIVQFMWLTPNPVNGGTSYNKTKSPCASLMPGGKGHATWLAYLDKIADFLDTISPIPVIFRFFHEMTGWWYWWGVDTECTDDEFVAAWQFTHTYLTEVRGVSNVLWLFATSRFSSTNATSAAHTARYMKSKYPGDDYVDILGFDCYENNTLTPAALNASCNSVFEFGLSRGKPVTIGETGHTGGSQTGAGARWWSEFLTGFHATGSLCHRAAYALTWENYNPGKFWVPLAVESESQQYDGFMDFYSDGSAAFSADAEYQQIIQDTGYWPRDVDKGLEIGQLLEAEGA